MKEIWAADGVGVEGNWSFGEGTPAAFPVGKSYPNINSLSEGMLQMKFCVYLE